MKRTEIIATLKRLIRSQPGVKGALGEITEDTRFDQIGFDSISILDFIYDVESELAVQTEMDALVRMEKVKDLIDYLETRLTG